MDLPLGRGHRVEAVAVREYPPRAAPFRMAAAGDHDPDRGRRCRGRIMGTLLPGFRNDEPSVFLGGNCACIDGGSVDDMASIMCGYLLSVLIEGLVLWCALSPRHSSGTK